MLGVYPPCKPNGGLAGITSGMVGFNRPDIGLLSADLFSTIADGMLMTECDISWVAILLNHVFNLT